MELLERADDEAATARIIAAACDGVGHALVIEAPAGLGKTSLLTHAAEHGSRAGMRVLTASGDMIHEDMPWSIVLQLFAETSPVAGHLVTSSADPMRSNSLVILQRLHRALADLTADRPVLMLVDDLQWADPQSLQFMRYLARRLERLPVAMVVAVRSGSDRADVAATSDQLVSVDPGAHRSLSPLSDDAIATLARHCAPSAPDATIRAITRSVGGNPFLCREVSGHWDQLVARHGRIRVEGELLRLQLWVRTRLGELGPAAARAAQSIAVLGRRATIPNVAAVADVSFDDIGDSLDSLHRGSFIDIEHAIRFRHPILREVVYAAIGPAQRQDLHHRCARVLSEHGAVRESAAHLLASGSRAEPWELDTLRAAAQADLAAVAPERAVRFLRTAVDLAPSDLRGHVLLELGSAELLAGHIAAVANLREALHTIGDDSAAIALQIGEWLYSCGMFTDAAEAYRRGLDNLPAAADRTEQALLIAGLHTAQLFSGTKPDRTQAAIARAATNPAADLDAADRILLSIAAGESALGLDRPRERVLSLARRAAAGDQTSEIGRAVLEPLACAFASCDEFARARNLLDHFIEAAQLRGEFVANTSLKAIRSLCCFRMGELDQAELDASDVLALAGTHPAARTHVVAACHALALTHLERNDVESAERSLDVDAERLWSDGWLLGWYLDAKGRVELARGRPEAALDAFERAGNRFTAAGGDGAWVDWRCGAAQAAHALGDQATARRWATDARRLAERHCVPTRMASALRTLALLERDPAARLPLLRDAAERLEHSEALIDRARVLIEWGSAQRRVGQRRDCREVLRRGRDLAQRCGAWALTEYAASELEASGARRPTLAVTGIAALTPAERRVAELAAAGRSNREIAETLFVSRKTVETHLGNVYRKLGVTGRGDLAGEHWPGSMQGSG